MNSMLDQQFKMRLAAKSDLEITLTLADYLAQLGVVVPLSSENFETIQAFVEEFDFSRDIFAEIEARVTKARKVAPVLMRVGDNPFALLSNAIFGTGISFSDEEIQAVLDFSEPDSLDVLVLSILFSRSERVITAYKAALDGSFEELEEMLRDDGVYAEIFGPDARELNWANAVEAAVDDIDTLPLAEIIEPGVDPMLARYYVSYPGTDQRHVIDATIAALFKREPEALRELLHKSGFTISRLPKKKATDA